MNFTNYTVEDFLTDDSFVSYCLRSDDQTVLFWETWLIANPDRKGEADKAKSLLLVLNGGWSSEQLEANFKSFQARVELPVIDQQRKAVKLWPRIAVAAAAVAAITLGTWLYVNEIASSRNASRNDEVVTSMNDIKPGSVGATLTLANGKTIKLSSATNGELAKEAGVIITKSADGQLIYEIASSSRNDGMGSSSRGTEGSLEVARSRDPSKVGMTKGVGMTTKGGRMTNTLSTAKGETYQVKLPDGTAVWLNAASRLTYSAALNQQGQRRVALEGEAYFQVAKDKAHPFIVESRGQQVEVLGTHFNINAYSDEAAVKTTLLEGSVRVASFTSSSLRGRAEASRSKLPGRGPSTELGEATILKPGQQSVFVNNQIKVQTVDTEQAMAWKNNRFIFDQTDLKSIMRAVARWYDVDVIYTGRINNEKYFGKISKYENVSELLRFLESAGAVHFRVEGRRIYVTGSK